MSINFKAIGRKNPRNPQAPAKYYASQKRTGKCRICKNNFYRRTSGNQQVAPVYLK